MSFSSVTYRLVARILLAALLLQAVVPAWANHKTSDAKHGTEICTSTGTKWVQTESVGGKSLPVSHAASDHCVFCSTTGASTEFNASDYLSFHCPQYQTVLQADSDPVVQFVGHSKLSRAPPSHS